MLDCAWGVCQTAVGNTYFSTQETSQLHLPITTQDLFVAYVFPWCCFLRATSIEPQTGTTTAAERQSEKMAKCGELPTPETPLHIRGIERS